MTERELEARLIHEQIPLPNGFDTRQEAALCRAMAQTRGVAHRPDHCDFSASVFEHHNLRCTRTP